ncbi:MAG TPA: multiheme c-type cytochrome [Candidatus Krumholzibacteria bacterium]|nr:multiheme c-type cytochrome [Candidatus Krumholzibacteria bacterium]
MPLWVCTAGDFYGTADVFNEAKSHFVARMMGELGYDAIGVGEMDLNFGLSALSKDARAYNLPIVCGNLIARVDSVKAHGDGDEMRAAQRLGTVFRPYHVVKKNGVRFGFLGLLSPTTKVRTAGASSVDALTYTIEDPHAAAAALVPELRKKCDVLVVLAHMDQIEAQHIAEAVPGIDLMVLGHDPSNRPIGDPIVVGNTRIIRATAQGQNVGQLDIQLKKNHQIAQLRNHIHPLSATYPDDPDMDKLLDEFDKKNREIQKDLYAREQLKGTEQDPFGVRYLGVGTCQSCHEAEFQVYMKTAHAHAYSTLSSEFVNRDTNCVGCHVTGYGDKGGFGGVRMRGAMVDLVDVQCEACHGPGAEHSRDGSYRTRAREACVRCHTPNDDPDFNFDKDWPLIAH